MCVCVVSIAGDDTICVDGDTCAVDLIENCSIRSLIKRANVNVWQLLLLLLLLLSSLLLLLSSSSSSSPSSSLIAFMQGI